MVLYGGRVKKPTRKESEAKNKKNCLQEGDMKKENHGEGQRRSRKLWELLDILNHYRDGRDKPQMKNQRCSKLKMEEPWL